MLMIILLILLHHLSRSFRHVQVDLGMLMLVIFYQNQNVSYNMFGLVSVTVEQVSSILNSIIASKATGYDELPARLIKDGSSVIAKPLTHIVNLTITTGNIPDDLKVAKVVSLYKM